MIETTTTGPIVIIGAGGFGREVLDVIEAINAAGGELGFGGFFDDGPVDEELLERRSARWLGHVDGAVRREAAYVIGIGSAEVRRRIDEQLRDARRRSATLAHPASSTGADVEIGDGSILTAGARVTTNVRLGRHVHLNLNSTVGHDSTLGDYVSVFPGATLSGNVNVGAGATVGTGANVLPGVTIGARAFVGAGAVVTRDVAPGDTVVGSPARSLLRS